MTRRTQGFTLIELMIVVAIIAILAATAVPAFLEYVRDTKTDEGVNYLKALGESSQAYYQNNAMPAFSLEDLAVDDALRNGEKGGYDWVYFPSSANPEHFVIEGYPASPYAGHLNFYMSQNGVIRYSEDGRADETSPILQKVTLDPDFQNPPPMGVPDCWYGPYTPSDPPRVPTPTTLQSQADADAALYALPFSVLQDFADTLPASFVSAIELADGLWPVTPQGDTSLVILDALDTDGDHAFHIDEILPAPAGDFYAGDAVPEVQTALGGCVAACTAANQSSVDCNVACSDTPGNPSDAMTLLDIYVAELAGLLELGIACDQRPDALAFFDLTSDPESFLSERALLAVSLVPSLGLPLAGSLAVALLAFGALGLGRRR